MRQANIIIFQIKEGDEILATIGALLLQLESSVLDIAIEGG